MNFTEIQNNLSDWEKLQYFSRPHDVFKLDWSSYDTRDFGDTFLPYVGLIGNIGIRIYDGAQVFGINNQDNNVLKLEKTNLFNLIIYTYPEGAVIDNNISRLAISAHEVCIFLKLDKSGNVRFRLVLGNKFKQFLDDYFKKNEKKLDASGFEKKIFETDKKSLLEYFGKSCNHQNTMLYLLSYLDVEINSEFDDGGIRIKRLSQQNTIVPFGVKSYSKSPEEAIRKEPENENVQFEIEIFEKEIDDINIEILNGKDIYSEFPSGLLDSNGKPMNKPKVYLPGKYYFEWDGFDKKNVYDSKALIEGDFKMRLSAKSNRVTKKIESKKFNFKYLEVEWLDIKIDRIEKRVDVDLRVKDIIDGGEKGTQVDCDNSGSNCPWNDISAEALAYFSYPPIQVRTISFADLRDAALNGINTFWSRHQGNYGKNVTINGEKYEVYVKSELSENGLKTPEIYYITNNKELKSGNWALYRKLIYEGGYGYWPKWKNHLNDPNYTRIVSNKGWYYRVENIKDFEMTSAHEIGHEILKAYGGFNYTYRHKATSTLFTQTPLGNNPLPTGSDEIDLMQYYDRYYDIPRTVASEEDVVGFFWLTKLKVK